MVARSWEVRSRAQGLLTHQATHFCLIGPPSSEDQLFITSQSKHSTEETSWTPWVPIPSTEKGPSLGQLSTPTGCQLWSQGVVSEPRAGLVGGHWEKRGALTRMSLSQPSSPPRIHGAAWRGRKPCFPPEPISSSLRPTLPLDFKVILNSALSLTFSKAVSSKKKKYYI